MPDPQAIYDYWTKRYMSVLLSGYKAFPQEIGNGLAMEERAGFLRGMMVEAGRSGLIPTAGEVIELMKVKEEGVGSPGAMDASKPVSNSGTGTQKPSGADPLPPSSTKSDLPNEKKEKVEIATPKQVEYLKDLSAKGQNYHKIGKYLIDNNLPEVKRLTKQQAMDLIDSLKKGAK